MSKLDAIIEKLNKFHGKPNEIKLKNDEGIEIPFKFYQLPMRYFPLMTKFQAMHQKGSKKNKEGKEEFDMELLNSNEQKEYYEALSEFISTSMAFSICIDDGLIQYNETERGLPKETLDKVKSMVELMSFEYLTELAEAVMGVYATGGDATKKSKTQKSEQK